MARTKETKIKLKQPIDLRYKCVKNFFGKKRIIRTSPAEQKRLKRNILKIFPDNLFYDDLYDENSKESDEKESSINVLEKPINLRYRYKRNLFGKRIQIETSLDEQQKLKKVFLKLFPDSLFYDDLRQTNSIKIPGKKHTSAASDAIDNIIAYEIADNFFEKAFGHDEDCDCDCDCDNNDCECDNNDCECDD